MVSPSLIIGASVAGGFGALLLGFIVAFCVYMHKSRSDTKQTPVKRMKADTKSIKKKAERLRTSATLKQDPCCTLFQFRPPHRILLPDPPQGISVVSSGARCVAVSWREPGNTNKESGVLHYHVYKRLSGCPNDWSKVGKAKPGVRKLVVKSLALETKYVFGVASVNKGGTSAIVESDPILVKAIPGPPTDVQISEKYKNTITLRWKPPKASKDARIISYHVMIQDGVWTDLTVLKAFDRYMEHKIIDLDLHTPYRFRIAAENEFGRGPYAETETVILTGEPDPPGKPTGPLKYSNITHHSVTLSWKPPAHNGSKPLKGYGVELYDPRKGTWQKCGACDVGKTTFTVTKLSEDITYRFRVVAMNDIGNGPPLAGKKIETKLHEIPPAQRSLSSRMASSRSSSRSRGLFRSFPSTPGQATGKDVRLDMDSLEDGSTRNIGIHLNGSIGGGHDSDSVNQRRALETRESGVQTDRDMLGPSVSHTETTFETETESDLNESQPEPHPGAKRPYNMAFSMFNRDHLKHLHRSINDRLQTQNNIGSSVEVSGLDNKTGDN